MKIYTKTGDKGYTSLFGGKRVLKSHIRVETYGTIDELNAFVGLLRDVVLDKKVKNDLLTIQENLFVIGSQLATPKENEKLKSGINRLKIETIQENHILFLENEIDSMNEQLPAMKHFILPGGHVTVSYCHIARNVCRRAERNCVNLHEISGIDPNIIMFLNRLSDYLFVLARKLAKDLSVQEIKWNDKESK